MKLKIGRQFKMLIYFIIALIVFVSITFCVAKFSELPMEEYDTLSAVIVVNFVISMGWILFVPLAIFITVLWRGTEFIIKLARR